MPLPRQRGDASAPMICSQVFDSISIHANGDIVCWCVDVNGQRVYGNVFKDRIADVWDGPAYREIRDWLLRSRPDTWCPAIDRHCPLRVVPATVDYDRSGHRIKISSLNRLLTATFNARYAQSKRASSKFRSCGRAKGKSYSHSTLCSTLSPNFRTSR